MRPVLFSIGPFNVFSFGFMLALGIIAAILVVRPRAKAVGVGFDRLLELLPCVLVSAMLGARLTYWALSGGGYSELFSGHGGLSFFGGMAFGSLAALALAHHWRLSKLELFDALAPGLAVGEAVTRLGCDIFGKPTTFAWGVLHNGVLVHPVQVYSFALNMAMYLFLLRYRPHRSGQSGAAYLIMLGITRFLLEFFRQGSPVAGPLTWGHMAAAAAALLGLAIHRFCPRKPAGASGRPLRAGDFAPLLLVPVYFIF